MIKSRGFCHGDITETSSPPSPTPAPNRGPALKQQIPRLYPIVPTSEILFEVHNKLQIIHHVYPLPRAIPAPAIAGLAVGLIEFHVFQDLTFEAPKIPKMGRQHLINNLFVNASIFMDKNVPESSHDLKLFFQGRRDEPSSRQMFE